MNKQMILGTIRHFLTLVSGAVLAGKAASLETAIPDLANKIAAGDIGTIVSAVLVVGVAFPFMFPKCQFLNNYLKCREMGVE